jgi:acyl-CoA dehydrogenase
MSGRKRDLYQGRCGKSLLSRVFYAPGFQRSTVGLVADFLYSVILMEEAARTACMNFPFVLHSDVVAPHIYHFGNEEQKKRWLPGCVSGDLLTAIVMTEPDAGSDVAAIRTTAVRDGNHYIINGHQ